MHKIILKSLISLLPLCVAAENKHAEAELLKSDDYYQSGEQVLLAIHMKMDHHWHTYWENPGDAGIAFETEWTLPEGWEAGPLQYPIPKRFSTGGIAGLGYEDEVVIPVFLTAGKGSKDDVSIKLKLDWLVCNDQSCVPGSAELSTELSHGESKPNENAKIIKDVVAQIPKVPDDMAMKVVAKDGSVMIAISAPENVDLSKVEVFPATPEAVDNATAVKLKQEDGAWQAELAIHEYADGPPDSLAIVLAGTGLQSPLRLEWSASSTNDN